MRDPKPEERPERKDDREVPVTEERGSLRSIPVVSGVDEAEERFRALAQHSRDSIAEITPEGKLLYVSPAFTELSGFSPGEVLGCNALELVHPDDLREVEAIREAAFAEESPAQLVFRSRHRNGSWRWTELTGRPYRTSAGELRGVLVSRDVTDRVRAEGALQEQLEAERHISDLSRRLLSLEPENFEAGLREGLGAAAAAAGADRAQFFFVDPKGRGVGGYYQWNAAGISERELGNLDDSMVEFAWSARRLLAGEVIHCARLSELPPEATPERESLGSATPCGVCGPSAVGATRRGGSGYSPRRPRTPSASCPWTDACST
jgi:PAS domain S-box-containing protein